MNRFLQKCGLFITPFLLGLIFLSFRPFDKSFGYNELLDSCDKKAWLYHRIFKDSTNIDVAFLGTSKTMCAMDDSLVELILQEQGHMLNVANLSFCQPGYTFQFALLKDIFRFHKPKVIIIELSYTLHRFSHPGFPFVANAEDIWLAYPIFHQKYFNDVSIFIQTRIKFLRNQILNISSDKLEPELPGNHYFQNHDSSMDIMSFNQAKEKTEKGLARFHSDKFVDKQTYKFEKKFPKKYLEKISALVNDNNAVICFLYLPSVGQPVDGPFDNSTLESFGRIIALEDSLFYNHTYWHDNDHLNVKAKDKLANYAANEINAVLKK